MMNRIVNALGLCLVLSCLVGCSSTSTCKLGPGRLTVNTEAHEYRGFDAEAEGLKSSVTLGVVTLSSEAKLEDVQPRVVDFGFGIDVPASTPQPQPDPIPAP